jgi:hypothetical protein
MPFTYPPLVWFGPSCSFRAGHPPGLGTAMALKGSASVLFLVECPSSPPRGMDPLADVGVLICALLTRYTLWQRSLSNL